jgi:hypothetical protein
MKIAYESTIEEGTRVSLRHLELSGYLRRRKWRPLVFVPVYSGLFFLLIHPPLTERIISASLFAVVYVVFHLSSYKKRLEKRIRRVLVRERGTSEPVPSEYEINDNAIVFRALGREICLSWSSVKEMRETEEAVEFIAVPTAIWSIPKRIFRDQTELNEWLGYANDRMGRVQQGPASDPSGRRA